jgi:hypothetical protein
MYKDYFQEKRRGKDMLNRLPLKFSYSLFAIVLLFSACKSVKQTKDKCRGDEESCDGNKVSICLDGSWTIWQDCSSSNMICEMISGSAQCMESGADVNTEVDVDTEVDSAVDDSKIDTDLEKVVGEPTESICNCVGKIFESKSGFDWIRDSCVANIDESCLSCLDEKVGGRDCAALVPAATALAMVECADRCPQSVTTMTDENQCLETVINLNLPGVGKTVEKFAECVCSNCLSSVQKCFSNQICPATLACLTTPIGTCVDSECEQETLCGKVYEIIFFLDEEEIYQIDDVNNCVAGRYNCYDYLS